MSKSTIRTAIIAFIFILIAGSGLGFMVTKTGQQALVLNQQIETLQVERTQEVSFQRLQKIAEETVNDRGAIESYFLKRESESIDFLNLVEELAPQAGVTLKTSGLNTIKPPGSSYEWIEVSFEFVGEQNRVDAFLYLLENLPYHSRVSEVNLKARSSEQWQAEVTMQVMIYAYDE